MTPHKHLLVISDLHLGRGRFLRNGQLNIMEDFEEDERLIEFLHYYSKSDKFKDRDVHLILNGDILNLIQTEVDGVFTHIQTEDYCTRALESILEAHNEVFEALGEFGRTKNLTYIIGNHDFGMVWPKAQKLFQDYLGCKVQFDHRVVIDGVHVEHGHRFEVINTVSKHKMFLPGPNGRQILNLPWASLFCINLLPLLKKERPHLDKVRPLSSYIKRSIIHDLGFFLKLCFIVIGYLIRTMQKKYRKTNSNYLTNWKLLKRITIYPRYAAQARSILKRKKNVKLVILGHSHIAEWRRYPEGKMYFNSGTWNQIPSIDTALHENITKLTYICVDLHNENNHITNTYLNIWQGQWKPYREESILTK